MKDNSGKLKEKPSVKENPGKLKEKPEKHWRLNGKENVKNVNYRRD